MKRPFSRITRVVSLLTLGSAVGLVLSLVVVRLWHEEKSNKHFSCIYICSPASILAVVSILALSGIGGLPPYGLRISVDIYKYVDPAFGFAAGWNYFIEYAIV